MFIRDPCGISCIIVTYIAVFYADYVVIRWIILETMQDSVWGPVHVVLFNTVVFLLAMSHLRAVLTDPGTVPLPEARLDFSDIHSPAGNSDITGDWSVCARCETYRPPRAHHCRVCGRCVRRMDHHCPWINNCVGERNQRHFVLFLLYVGVLAVYSVGMVLTSWITQQNDKETSVQVRQTRVMHCVILLLESALFGMFVTAILFEQLQAILGDETGVEAVQGKRGATGPRRPRMQLLGDVCGPRKHPLLWLLPCSLASRRHRSGGLLVHHHV